MNEALFSSSRDDWETPPEFFAALNEEFRFTLDVCALPETAKCAAYFTPEDDGLSRAWIAPRGARYFVTRRIRGERKTARDRRHGSRKPPRRARGQRGGKRLKIRITKELPTDPENRPEVGGVYEVVRQAPGQYGPILFIKVGGVEVGVLGGEYEPAAEVEP